MKSLFLVCLSVALLSVGLAQEASPTPSGQQIEVYVTGAVGQTGTYILPVGASVLDAIKAAHGFQAFAARVILYRGAIHGHARSFARFKVQEVRQGTRSEVLLDKDLLRVTEQDTRF